MAEHTRTHVVPTEALPSVGRPGRINAAGSQEVVNTDRTNKG
jgi:hypothetical protein